LEVSRDDRYGLTETKIEKKLESDAED